MADPGVRGLSVVLILIGVILVLFSAVTAYRAYKVGAGTVAATSFEEALTESAGILLDVLVRIAFLGIILAAGSILISKGIDLLKADKGVEE